MNSDQIGGILRVAVPTVCAWLAAKGFSVLSDSGLVAEITTAVIAVGAAVWSVVVHTNAAKIKAVVAISPEMKVMVPNAVIGTDDKIAALVADTKVPNVVQLTPDRYQTAKGS
jgi:hypothetical protein